MLKKIAIGFSVVIALLFVFIVKTIYNAGEFKSIKPHSDYESMMKIPLAGPEDIEIDSEDGMAFISSSDRRAAIRGEKAQGGIYGYSLVSDKPVLINLTKDFKQEFHPCGINLYRSPSGQRFLFVINSIDEDPFGDTKAGSKVEIFEYVNRRLNHLETITGSLLSLPNDILGVGPRQFYFSNDHGANSRLGKAFEVYLGLPIANVVYYDGKGFRKVAENIVNANGLAMSRGGNRLYVSSTIGRLIRIYNRDLTSGSLTKIKDIALGTGPDNINMDSDGTLWVGCIPQMLTYSRWRTDSSKRTASQVLKIRLLEDDNYEIKDVFLNSGKDISGSSVAAPFKNRLLIGGAWEDRFIDCTKKD